MSLWFLLGSAREAERSAPELALGQRLELDGNANLDGDDETISVAALNGEARPQAVPVVLHEDGLSVSTVSAASTVSELLAEKGVVIEHADYLSPSAGSLVTAGTHVYIEHARELSLSVGGDTTTIHSR